MANNYSRKWDLKDVLPAHSGSEFEAIVNSLNDDVKRLESYKGRLDTFTKEDMGDALMLKEMITERLWRFGTYGYMWFSENTQSQEAGAFFDKMEQLEVDINNKTLFFDLFLRSASQQRIEELMPENKDYERYIVKNRKLIPYTRSEDVEQAINLKNLTSKAGWINHYELFTNAFMYKVEIDGKTEELTTSQLRKYFHHPDPEKRELAYKKLWEKYSKEGQILDDIYKKVVTDWKNENIKIRDYDSPISVKNLENDISDEAVETLLSVCRKNNDIFQDFFRIKAKLLGMDKMVRYHIYAPLEKTEKRVEYSDAISLVLKTFDQFDERFGSLARNIFDKNHVDSELRNGKMVSAYCIEVTPKIIPYLLLNYNDTLDDVFTMAHELGHGVHGQMASERSILTYKSPIPLCETASMFGEMVLFDKVMGEEKDSNVKKDLLINYISKAYASIQRQAYFTIFEIEAHKAISEGATTDDLCNIYLSNLKEHFGDAVEVPEEFKWEWTCIPHMYCYPFYCYGYTFGNLLTLGLYDKYKKEGDSFKPDYFKILSYGGLADPEEILNEVGIDAKSPEFWQGGYNIIRDMINQLEKM